jgi:signal peptidase II
MKKRVFSLILIATLVVLDQLSKALIAGNIALNSSKEVIPNFFHLVHIRNKGAIFGFFSRSADAWVFILLTLASFAALGLVVFYFFKTPPREKFLILALSLILAGALGNLIDRVMRGSVIDFLDFSVKGWHWPSFNVADSCITVGALLLVFLFIFKRSSTCSPS